MPQALAAAGTRTHVPGTVHFVREAAAGDRAQAPWGKLRRAKFISAARGAQPIRLQFVTVFRGYWGGAGWSPGFVMECTAPTLRDRLGWEPG